MSSQSLKKVKLEVCYSEAKHGERIDKQYTVIDNSGNTWTNFPYHLKQKTSREGIPSQNSDGSVKLKVMYFEGIAKDYMSTVYNAKDWKFSQISEKAFTAPDTNIVPVEADNVPKEQKEVVDYINTSYALKPDLLKMSEIKWKYLVRSAVRGKNIMMTGPAGCGKTLAAKSLVKALDRPDYYFNLGATQDPRSTLIGNVHYNKEKGTYFSESLFVKAIQTENAIILLDELTRAHPEAWNILMPVLDSGQRYLRLDEADGQTEIKVADGVTFIATANIGAAYTATRVLDKAMLDRFVVIEMDTLGVEDELDLLSTLYPNGNKEIMSNIAEIAFMTRTEASTDTPRIEAGISTRTTVEMAGLAYDGFTLQDIADVTIYPQYDSAGGVDSERTFVKQIVQKFVKDEQEGELFTAEEIEEETL
tara:strand:+ start:3035 stop:4291 length:1257 start_codon:yes stop_codon:yes gene_type:complete